MRGSATQYVQTHAGRIQNTRQMTHMRFNSPVFILIVKILVRIVYIFHRHLDSAIAEYKQKQIATTRKKPLPLSRVARLVEFKQ